MGRQFPAKERAINKKKKYKRTPPPKRHTTQSGERETGRTSFTHDHVPWGMKQTPPVDIFSSLSRYINIENLAAITTQDTRDLQLVSSASQCPRRQSSGQNLPFPLCHWRSHLDQHHQVDGWQARNLRQSKGQVFFNTQVCLSVLLQLRNEHRQKTKILRM